MCFALPMSICALDGLVARCEARGVVRTVSLFLLQDEALAVGDVVLVHLDSAVRKMDQAEADVVWAIYDEISSIALAPRLDARHSMEGRATQAAARTAGSRALGAGENR